MKLIVVVPDGISVASDGKLVPSFVYRAALENAMEIYSPGDEIFLAPANEFGFGVFEQELGGDYLKKINPGAKITIVQSQNLVEKYIDTFGNAKFLRGALEAKNCWPMAPIILVAAHIHLNRSILVFKKAGFEIEKAIPAYYSYSPGQEKIAKRLFYYNHKRLHQLYEWAAYLRDKIIY